MQTAKVLRKLGLTWLNKYGVWDYYNFTKKNTSSTNINRTSFNKVKGNWNEPKDMLSMVIREVVVP